MTPEIPEALAWLFARQRFGIQPGLERIRALLAQLGHPEGHFRAVLVGGTNGKGSTAATLASMLQASGERVGLFTSPHLTRFGERFVVDGHELSEAVVLDALQRVRPHAEAVEASFFEIVTALGCLLFTEAGVSVAVMEVGLGGRFDATNALEPELSVITGVALDHTEILGETPEAIAQEKAGILRPDKAAVAGIDPQLLPILEATGANLWALGREIGFTRESSGWAGNRVTVQLAGQTLDLKTPLLGAHGAQNAALAAAAAYRLGVSGQAIQAGAAQTRWPGRLEVVQWQGRRLLLDGAHNPDGAQALAHAVRELGAVPLPVIFGAAADKDISGVAAALRPIASQVILTRAVLSPRAAEPAALAPAFAGLPVGLASTPAEALALLPPTDALICGSLYLIGEMRPLLLGQQTERHERWQ